MQRRSSSEIGTRRADAVPPHAVRRGDGAGTAPTSRTCAAAWRSTICRDVFRDSEFRVFKQIVADGGVVRGFVVPGRQQLLAQPARRARRPGEGSSGFTGLIWVRPGEPPTQLGEGAQRSGAAAGARSRRRVGRRPAADGRRARPTRPRSCSAQLRLQIAEEGEPAQPRAVRVPVGHRLSAARVGATRTAAGTRCTIRSRRRTTRTATSSRASPARCAPRPTTWC